MVVETFKRRRATIDWRTVDDIRLQPSEILRWDLGLQTVSLSFGFRVFLVRAGGCLPRNAGV
jgi:hypothetical protein